MKCSPELHLPTNDTRSPVNCWLDIMKYSNRIKHTCTHNNLIDIPLTTMSQSMTLKHLMQTTKMVIKTWMILIRCYS